MPFHDAVALLSAAQESLTHITIFGELTDIPEAVLLDLYALTHLSPPAEFVGDSAGISGLLAMVVLLESGGLAPRKLESLSIMLDKVDNPDEATTIFDTELWARFNDVTQQDRDAGFRESSIVMTHKGELTEESYMGWIPIGFDTYMDWEGPELDFTQFGHQVPFLRESGKLHVLYNGDVVTPDTSQ